MARPEAGLSAIGKFLTKSEQIPLVILCIKPLQEMASVSSNDQLQCILCDKAVSAAELANHVQSRHVGNADWWNCGDCNHHVTSYNDIIAHRDEMNHHSKVTSARELLEMITEKTRQGKTSEVMDSNIGVRLRKELKFKNHYESENPPFLHKAFPCNFTENRSLVLVLSPSNRRNIQLFST